MPNIIRIERPSLLSPGQPLNWKRCPITPEAAVHCLSHVPDAASLRDILQRLDRSDRTVSHIVIPELGGTFRPDGIRMLYEVMRTRVFTENLVRALDFVCDTLASIDADFSTWLTDQLYNKPDL
ncbi:hypothetical protein BGX34_007389, partial [Mortierella sp. NVP85]